MNFKTTLSLLMTLVILVLALFLVRSNSPSAISNTSTPSTFPANVTSRDLIEDKLVDVVTVVAQRKGKEEWVFEKIEPDDGGTAQWHMTAPHPMKVVSWEVDKFSRQLGNLRYQISYKPGQAGAVSAAAAGLEPPEAVVTMTDADGKKAAVEIGLPASAQTTYVRLIGDESIVVGQSNLRNLFKPYAMAYRDKAVWSFDANDVTRFEIVQRPQKDGSTNYVFVRDGARWMMQSPTTARATDKVNEAVRAISRLRALEWMDTGNATPASFGLDPALLTVRVTVEEDVPVPSEQEGEGEEEEEETEAETKTEKKITTYELRVSGRSPIGEDTKTYMLIGDTSAVATVMKTTTDKFMPDIKQWRDMMVTAVNVSGATRIEVSTGGESFTLTKQDEQWKLEGSGQADDSVVEEFLKAIGKMTAVAYVESDQETQATMGFDQPQSDIRLTIPGVEGVERITIGQFTDEAVKRLVYVRRNESSSIAKVRTGIISALLKNRLAYRDRTIIDLPVSRIDSITLVTKNPYRGARRTVTLQQQGGEWKMIKPVEALTRNNRAEKLAASLSTLIAESIVTESDDELTAYGLHQPSVTVTLTPVTEENDASSTTTLTLTLAQHNGRYFAHRADQPGVYQVQEEFYNQLLMEYRKGEIFSFEDTQVRQFSVRSEDQKHVFNKHDDEWVYLLEPDLPLDSKKVDELLLRIRDLKTPRYVMYSPDNLSKLGFSHTRHEITVTLTDGTSQTLLITDQLRNLGADRGYFAMLEDHDEVFLVSSDTLQRFAVSLPDLEQ